MFHTRAFVSCYMLARPVLAWPLVDIIFPVLVLRQAKWPTSMTGTLCTRHPPYRDNLCTATPSVQRHLPRGNFKSPPPTPQETPIPQRAANRGSDPSWLNLAFLGRPDWTENRGAPKTPNSTTTDLTPHLRPSDNPSLRIQNSKDFSRP